MSNQYYGNSANYNSPYGYPPPSHPSRYEYEGYAMSQGTSQPVMPPYGSPTSPSSSLGTYSPSSESSHYFDRPLHGGAIQVEYKAANPNRKSTKSRRSSSGSSSGGNYSSSGAGDTQYTCLVSGCDYSSSRAYDLKRHINTHNPVEVFPCPYSWCGRGANEKPFTREDHLTEHLRKVHMRDIPKREKGGRKKK